jgi:glycosyltransferase involved in cell wall biosynthesis
LTFLSVNALMTATSSPYADLVPRRNNGRRPLRCVVLATWYPSVEEPISGIFVREAARAIARFNDVAVLYAHPVTGRRPPRPSDALEDGLRTVRVPFRAWPTPSASLPLRLRALVRGHRHLVRTGFTPDVLQAHVYLAGAGAVLIARRTGVAVVVVEHLGSFVQDTVAPRQRLLAKMVYEAADLVCPVSVALGHRLAALAPRARLLTVPSQVDTARFHPPVTAPARLGPARLLVVALLRPVKGVEYLLHALAIVRARRPVALDVAGDGPNRPELEALARRLGLQDAVRFLGRQSASRIAELMRGADLLVVPSLSENLPVVIIEAQATGLPVVASDVGGVRELVDERSGQLVPAADPAALAAAIEAVLARPTAYDRTAISIRAKESFGFEAIGARWDTILREVAGRTQ